MVTVGLRIVNVFWFLCCVYGMLSLGTWLFLWFLICGWSRYSMSF